MATERPKRGQRTATHQAKAAMGKMMHERVEKSSKQKERSRGKPTKR